MILTLLSFQQLNVSFRPCPNVAGYFWKKENNRSVLESFWPIHMKTLKRWKYDSIPYRACVMLIVLFCSCIWCMTSWPFQKAGGFKNLHSGESFWKPAFLIPEKDVFMWTKGWKEEKSPFSKISGGRGQRVTIEIFFRFRKLCWWCSIWERHRTREDSS